MKRVLLTGASGFVGSHVLAHLLVNTDWHITCICSWSHRGNPLRITDDAHYQTNRDRVKVVTHDLEAPIPLGLGHFDYILNLASESHVDRSINDPVPFVVNNTKLVLNVLEYAREYPPEVLIQFSTDEVYGPAYGNDAHVEWATIMPSNPYAASKAAQEAIAISYWRTYGVPLIITNTMNVIGERQHPEKFMPKVIKALLNDDKMQIHGSSLHEIGSRSYIHARNVADALLFLVNDCNQKQLTNLDRPPARFNIVGEYEINNLDFASRIAEIMGKKLRYSLVDFHEARPGHDRRYALDGSQLESLGWKPPRDFDDSFRDTVNWTLNHRSWLHRSALEDV